MCGEDAKQHIGDKEQDVVEDVGEHWSNENGQSDDACLLVRVHVSGVVAMEDGFCVEGQWNGVNQRQHREISNLNCMSKHDSQRTKRDKYYHISQSHILETNTCKEIERKPRLTTPTRELNHKQINRLNGKEKYFITKNSHKISVFLTCGLK